MALRDFLNILFKRRWILVLVFLLFSGGLVASAYYWPPSYDSVATIYLQNKHDTIDQSLVENPSISRTSSLLPEDVLSEVFLLGSAEIRRLVVDELGLENEPLDEESTDVRREWERYLHDNLSIEPETNSHIISLTFTDNRPERAARIVSAYADCYLKFRRAMMRDSGTTGVVRTELEESRKRLAELDEQLRDFDREWKLIDAGAQKLEALEFLANLRSQAGMVQAELGSLDHELQVYTAALASNAPELWEVDEVRGSATIELLESQLAQLDLERATLLSHSTEEYKPVQRVERGIEDVRQARLAKASEIVRSVLFNKETMAEAKRAELAIHQQLIDEVERELAMLSEKGALREGLVMDRDLMSDHVKQVSRRLEQRELDQSLDGTGNIAVVVASYGSVPLAPSFPPSLPLVILASVLLGLALAFGVVVVLDLVDDTFVTAEDVEEHLGLPVLGSVPRRFRHRLSSLVGGG